MTRELIHIFIAVMGFVVYGMLTLHSVDPREFSTPCYGVAQCREMGGSVP